MSTKRWSFLTSGTVLAISTISFFVTGCRSSDDDDMMPVRVKPVAARVVRQNPANLRDVEAEAIVASLGGKCVRDAKIDGHPIVEVDLRHTSVMDSDLVVLAGLDKLRKLYLRNTQITDNGLKALAALEELEFLSLDTTRINGSGFKDLASLQKLRTLKLSETRVTDAGVQELTKLSALQSLTLCNTFVTDSGLRDIAALKNLQFLDVTGARVTDAGWVELRKALPNCKL